MQLRITPEAEHQVTAIEAWWSVNRQVAPALFREELASGLDLISRMPRVGKRRRHASVPGLRRLLLRSSRYHIYYAPASNDVLFILAVWHSARGGGPDLQRLS